MYMSRYDENNVKRFKKGEQKSYLCSMCGQYTTLNDSVSHRGFNLVCNHCFWKVQHITGITNLLEKIQSVGKEIEESNNIK